MPRKTVDVAERRAENRENTGWKSDQWRKLRRTTKRLQSVERRPQQPLVPRFLRLLLGAPIADGNGKCVYNEPGWQRG